MRNIIFTSVLGWVLTAFAAYSDVCITGDIEKPIYSDKAKLAENAAISHSDHCYFTWLFRKKFRHIIAGRPITRITVTEDLKPSAEIAYTLRSTTSEYRASLTRSIAPSDVVDADSIAKMRDAICSTEKPTNSYSNWTRGFVESGGVVKYEVRTAWEAENLPITVAAFTIESCEVR